MEDWWDALNWASNKLEQAASLPLGQLLLASWSSPHPLPHAIELRAPGGPGPSLSQSEWRNQAREWEQAGWRLQQIEFRHNQFELGERGRPGRSVFYFSAHLTNALSPRRAALEGPLRIAWGSNPGSGSNTPTVAQVDARELVLTTRQGEPPFRAMLAEDLLPPEKTAWIDPVIAADLNDDGLLEVVLPVKNLVYRPQPDRSYRPAPLLRHPPPDVIFSALLADFDGDGSADLLLAAGQGLICYKGSREGAFSDRAQVAWQAALPLINPMVMAGGDIDRDGDLDVFVGQYRVPTLGQVLKPAYYQANDGHPSYLLVNNGAGSFTDGTATAGLESKRRRRVFSASFSDLDQQPGLDLAVISDFAGLDLYQNDGQGRFTDVTSEWVAEPEAFGMSHALADFNVDGQLDLLMIGMNSATASRLDHLQLARPGPAGDPVMRRRMSFGNRLFIRSQSGYRQTAWGDSLARSGWSWGCGAFDFDNDGFPDVYIANGNETRQTVRDYDAEFWLHDMHIDESVDDASATKYFMAKFARTRGQGWSYGGYEKNRLFWNRRASRFLDVAHLLGLAIEDDSSCVIADDLDGDGRVDLIVTTADRRPQGRQTLLAFRNQLETTGPWIGFQFSKEAGRSPLGARVVLQWDNRRAVRQVVTGDSFRSQHSPRVHFGLGASERVDRVEIEWADGRRTRLETPAINRYHLIGPGGPGDPLEPPAGE